MSDQVFMSPNNGALCVAVPLFKACDLGIEEDSVKFFIGYGKPVAYAMDIGDERLHFFNAEWVEEKLECLGEL